MTKSHFLRLAGYGLVALLLATPTTASANEPPTYTVVGFPSGPDNPKRPGQVIAFEVVATDPDGDPVTIEFVSELYWRGYRILELDGGFVVAEYATTNWGNPPHYTFDFELSYGVNTVLARIYNNYTETFCTTELAVPYAKSEYLRVVPAVPVGGTNIIDRYVQFAETDFQKASDFINRPYLRNWYLRVLRFFDSEIEWNHFTRSMQTVALATDPERFLQEVINLPPGVYSGRSVRCVENQ